jgi:hypothetical protein
MVADQGTRDIVAVIREKIAAARLASSRPDKVFVGRASGKSCNGCDLPITDPVVEYEADLPEGRTLRFHQRCFEVWQEERAKFLKPTA